MKRRLAVIVCRVLQGALPPGLRSWGQALDAETAAIPDDAEALRFALGGFFGLFPRALLARLPSSLGTGCPRATGIACASGAVLLGLAYMAIAGAPLRYLAVNAGALASGLMMLALSGRVMPETRHWSGATMIVLAAVLLATAMLGDRIDGAARWVKLGPLVIQPSLILLPVMILGFVRSRGALSTAGIVAAAAALAVQPDRAMAGMLAASLAILAILRTDRLVMIALVGSVIGFILTLLRADTLSAVPYVDRIFYSSFEIHALAGAAVTGGAMLLIVPAIAGWRHDAANRVAYAAFAAIWLAAIAAAALGNYPTPIVGYGGSAIVGYVLSLAMLPRLAEPSIHGEPAARGGSGVGSSDRHPRVAIA